MTTTGIKRSDIQPCILCGQGVMHSGAITFYRLKIQHFIVDTGEVGRQVGMELMMGNPAIAAALGPDGDIAQAPCPEETVLVCMDCALGYKGSTVLELLSKLEDRSEKES